MDGIDPGDELWGAYLTLDELSARLEQWPFCPDGLEIYRRWRAGAF